MLILRAIGYGGPRARSFFSIDSQILRSASDIAGSFSPSRTNSKNAVNACGAVNNFGSSCVLRAGAPRHGFHQPRSSRGFRRQNGGEAISIDIDEGGYKSIEVAH
jgi:hypothetical protein